MKINFSALPASALLFIALSGLGASQAQMPASPAQPSTNEARSPSAIMQPALNTLQQTLSGLRTDKWKMSSALRQTNEANINSIEHDLDNALPQLLATADGAPNSAAQMLPAYRNTEALYDVLLRVAEAANFSAPPQQAAALQQARATLEDARRAFADRLQSAAVARDQQVHTLEATMHATKPAPAPIVRPCPTPPTHHTTRKRTTKKTTPKPTQPTNPRGTTTSP
jgi:hypothetical protein